MNKKLTLTIILFLFLFSLNMKSVSGYEYGGPGPSRQIIIDKQLKPNSWSNWQDNLSAVLFTFIANDIIDFKIIVKNSGEDQLKNIQLTDYLPDYLNFLSATTGYTKNNQEISWKIDSLSAGAEQVYLIQAQVVGSDQLKDKGGFCLTNKSTVKTETGEADEDTAEFCLESKVLGAQTLPQAGVNLWVVISILIGISGLGLVFKKHFSI